MDSRGWTLCIPSEVIDSWCLKCASRSAHLMRKHVVQAIIAQTCASRRFVSSNETTASGLPTRHRAFEHAVRPLRLSREPCPFVSNSSANIKT
ncbi:hypothetical protein Pyn_07636 [Prunus yedoensis var. nudiflora]|uniref:Uncharacterized protein n=1 Tax=Prunus yedoensis var. nudiflora TaxID=2094558 RepID=A0A314XWP2_PRUYE|nr:hypothetical protein Pyn_41122 [Prunus yedoensis var. nudiflora]PQQ07529.1 hypothetical protein Pyn_07636 [Prunus yedoensis var. nudiflora]